jgi:hypothetical protein
LGLAKQEMNETLAQYGLSGIVIAGLAWFVIYLMKQQKEERDENRKAQEKNNEEHNRSLNKNTEVLSELTTLIKTLKK